MPPVAFTGVYKIFKPIAEVQQDDVAQVRCSDPTFRRH